MRIARWFDRAENSPKGPLNPPRPRIRSVLNPDRAGWKDAPWDFQKLRMVPRIAALFGLLCTPFLIPGDRWVKIMRGEKGIDAEIRHAQTHGYYESILSEPNRVQGAKTGALAKAEKEPLAPAGWTPFAESGIVKPVNDYLRWRMKPNLNIVWNGARFSTNRLGYRTPDVAIPKPPGVYRIVVIGSSNTMGHGVADDEIFVRKLETWLNCDDVGQGRRVEVVNMAVSSDAPSQNLLRLELDVPALEPDWILNDITVLDYSLEELHLHTTVRNNWDIPFGYVRSILREAGVSSSDSLTEFSVKLQGSTEALLDGAYQGWAAEAAKLGCPMTMIHLPRTDAKIDNRNLKRMAERLAARYSLPVIDLTNAYRGHELSEYRLSPWDKHPSVLGHQLIFEALRNALISQGGGPGYPLEINGSDERRETELDKR